MIFEGNHVGGTCLNVGCIPTKTYVHSANFEEARERMAAVVPQLRQGVEGILSHPNITLVRENAHFENHGDWLPDPQRQQDQVPVPVICAGEENHHRHRLRDQMADDSRKGQSLCR